MKPYHRGNKFSPFVPFADAAVDLAGVPIEEYSHIYTDAQGLPHHLDSRELYELAAMLLEYVQRGKIDGLLHTEEGELRKPRDMLLSRKSFQAWFDDWASI